MKRALALLILLALLGTLFVAYAFVQLDPLRQYVTYTDHGVQFKGGKLDGALINFILSGPTQGNLTRYVLVEGAYATASYRAVEPFAAPKSAFAPPDTRDLPRALGRIGSFYLDMAYSFVVDHWLGAKDLLSFVFDSLTMNARATCAGGNSNCYWIGGTGTYSTTSHWSDTSGGATCTCTPVSTDVINFDAGSGTGTVTLTAAITVHGINLSTANITLDTTSSNWGVSVTNAGGIVIGGSAFNTRASSVTMDANFTCTTGYVTNTGGTWTVGNAGGQWTNGCNSASWHFAANLILSSNASSNATWAGTLSGGNEFLGNVTLDANTASAITYTEVNGGGNALTVTGTLTIQDTFASGVSVTYDPSTSNYPITAGSVVLASKGILNGRASTITVNGLDFSLGTFTYATSTIVFVGTGTATWPATTNYAYNITVNASITVTSHGWMSIRNVLIVNGAVSLSSAGDRILLYDVTTITDPFVLGASGSITGATATNYLFYASTTSPSYIDIPGGTYTLVTLYLGHRGVGSGQGTPYKITGNVSFYQVSFDAVPADPFYLNSQTYNVTLVYAIGTYEGSGATTIGIVATSGTWTIGGYGGSGGFTVGQDANATSFYVQFGSSTWTVHAYYTNISTNTSLWQAGTGSMTFDDQIAPATFHMSTGLGSTTEFNNLTFASVSNSAGVTFSANVNILISGTLTISSVAFTTTLDLTASNYSISATSVTIGAGGILNGRASSITTTNWDSSAGTLTVGTSTLTFSATGSATFPAVSPPSNVYNLVVNISVTTTFHGWPAVSNVLTANGAVSMAAGTDRLYINDDTLVANPLVIGASGSVTAVVAATLFLWAPTTYTSTIIIVPSSTYTNLQLYFVPTGSASVPGQQFALSGSISVFQLVFDVKPGKPFYLTTGSYNVTVQYQLGTYFGSGAVAAGIVATSGTWSVGSGGFINNANGSLFYLQLGSVTWNEQGPYTNTSTSASWNAGTSTVVFGPQASYNYSFSTTLGTSEFNNVQFTSSLTGPGPYAMTATQQTDLGVGGTLTIQGNAYGSILLVSNGHNVTVNGAVSMSGPNGSNGTWQMGSGVITMNSTFTMTQSASSGGSLLAQTSTWYVHGNFTLNPGPGTAPYGIDFGSTNFHFFGALFSYLVLYYQISGTSTWFWDGTGAQEYQATANGIYNLTVALTSTFVYDAKVILLNALNIAGTIQPKNLDPTLEFFIEGATTCSPITLTGASYSFVYAYLRVDFNDPSCSTFHIPGGTYSHLEIRFDILGASYTGTAVLDGDIALNDCKTGFDSGWCALLVTGPSPTSMFDTQGHNITLGTGTPSAVGGVWFIGDYETPTDAIVVHMRTSRIVAYGGIGPGFNSTTYFDSATVIAYPEHAYSPAAIYGGGVPPGVTIYAGSANITVHGAIVFWSTGTPGGESLFWYAQSSTLTTINDQACSGGNLPQNSSGVITCGGDINIAEQSSFIDFGTSTWNIVGSWRNRSTSASWNASSGTLNFTGSGTITPTSGAITLPEFPTMAFANGASYTLATNSNLTFNSLQITGVIQIVALAVGGGGPSITIASSSGSYATLSAWRTWAPSVPNIVFPITLSTTSATLTVTLTGVQAPAALYKDGNFIATMITQGDGSKKASVTGNWSTHIIMIGPPTPIPGGGATDPFSCSYSYALLSVNLVCTSNISVADPSTIKWLVDSQVAGYGSVLRTVVLVLAMSRTVTVEMVITAPYSSVDSTGSVVISAPMNVLVYALLLFAIVASLLLVLSAKAKKARAAREARRAQVRRTVFIFNGPPPRRPPTNGRNGGA